ncbi:MAG: hypothetical protein MI754_00250, partial [Chromatiales bacterium]|nr:hypothetical protein [Chromatiales bacterium]
MAELPAMFGLVYTLLGPVNTNLIGTVEPEKAPLSVTRRLFGTTKLHSSCLDWCFFRLNPLFKCVGAR